MAPNGSPPAGPGDPMPLGRRLHKLYRKARKRVLGPIQKPLPSEEPKARPAAVAIEAPAVPAPVPPPPPERPAVPPVPAAAPFVPVLPRSTMTGEIKQAAAPGSIDAFAMRALQIGERRTEEERADPPEPFFPPFELTARVPVPPPPGVAFLVPADTKSLPAVEMLLLSLLDVYPALASPILIVSEEEPGAVLRRRLARISPQVAFVTAPPGWDAAFPSIAGEPARQRLTLYALTIGAHDRIVVIQPDALVLGDISEAWTRRGLTLAYDLTDAGTVPTSPLTGDFLYDIEILSLPAEVRGEDAAAAMAALAQGTGDEAAADKVLDRQPVRRLWNLFARDREKTVLPIRCSMSAMYVLKCLEGSRAGVCLMHDNGEDPWLPGGGK